MTGSTPRLVNVLRWGARLLSGVILLFFGFFLVAHIFGDADQASRALNWKDYIALSSLVVAVSGLALAWKWERAGSFITLISIAVCSSMNWRILLFPGTLIPVCALIFLMSYFCSTRLRDIEV